MNRQEVTEKLRQYICDKLVKNPQFDLAEDEPIITGGIIDSFSLAHIAVFIEVEFGVVIPDTELTTENMDTLRQMVDRVLAG